MAGGRAWGRWQRLDEVVHRRGMAAKLVPPTAALEPRRLSLQWHREHGGDRGCWTVGARRGGPCLGRRRHLPATRSFADQLEGRILARWLRPSIVSHSGSEDGHSSCHELHSYYYMLKTSCSPYLHHVVALEAEIRWLLMSGLVAWCLYFRCSINLGCFSHQFWALTLDLEERPMQGGPRSRTVSLA
ncbi:uncharacterized protein LOC119302332 isoform X2 [Triticum dicoccoides]|uniref:uncharacterized protein LOC119302332 isoform X2 n=1 Tax=Triticum dicoccoides TaxID=85692 RepID=UPI00188F6A9A|nr:uncharacterized protein LOC119302332 isoform X2 [Triticum dicoccoides]XP_044380338.1 uncharacterized protein LOC123102926 isoform X2 [Triticum aestivum]XP_044380339.1 uncharacterized protein LOC123102926 isoform X2 [Triticum aestivum]XP_044380340.1 uncharacterized protein LOC123102926 isoform X2 [Triticum aestivum]XP_044380341.1 uncharacterized protein LOC123102926 isoform X2 [Triticum aestivum]